MNKFGKPKKNSLKFIRNNKALKYINALPDDEQIKPSENILKEKNNDNNFFFDNRNLDA